MGYQRSGEFWYCAHFEDIDTQLNDGIRGLMLDLHWNKHWSKVVLCHGGEVGKDALDASLGYAPDALTFCPMGQVVALDELIAIRQWVELNPREVIVIALEIEGPAKPNEAQLQSLFT